MYLPDFTKRQEYYAFYPCWKHCSEPWQRPLRQCIAAAHLETTVLPQALSHLCFAASFSCELFEQVFNQPTHCIPQEFVGSIPTVAAKRTASKSTATSTLWKRASIQLNSTSRTEPITSVNRRLATSIMVKTWRKLGWCTSCPLKPL